MKLNKEELNKIFNVFQNIYKLNTSQLSNWMFMHASEDGMIQMKHCDARVCLTFNIFKPEVHTILSQEDQDLVDFMDSQWEIEDEINEQ